MTSLQRLRQANAFAMIDGLKFGLYWCFGFLCVIKGVANGSLASMAMLSVLTTPVFGAFLAHRFERQVRSDERVGFPKALAYSALLYVYASLLLSVVAWAYFNWFDHGEFINYNLMVMTSPQYAQALSEAGLQQQLDVALANSGFDSLEAMIKSITPIDIASGLFNMNLLISVILALPTSLFAITWRQQS